MRTFNQWSSASSGGGPSGSKSRLRGVCSCWSLTLRHLRTGPQDHHVNAFTPPFDSYWQWRVATGGLLVEGSDRSYDGEGEI